MAVEHIWVGAVTPTSAWVRGKVTGASVRLAVDTDAALETAVFFGPVAPTADGMASIVASGLDPDTRYWFAFEEDSVLQTDALGQFRTHPPAGAPASFTFAGFSCAGQNGEFVTDRVSNRPAFDTVRQRAVSENWLFGLHMGDLHYRDIGSGVHVPGFDLQTYRDAYDDTLTFNGVEGLNARQGQLYRNLPIVYQWDDHDFGGNNSNKNAEGKENAQLAYRERLPHYPLPAGAGAAPVFHSFQVGRVLFMVADHRSDRDPNGNPDGPGKTMLGSAQKAWMADVLANTSAKFLVWATEQYQSAVDSWQSFATEQAELRQLFGDLGWLDRMLILSGDIHALAMDSGNGGTNPWGVPTFLFSSLDSGPAPGETADPIVGFFDLGPSSPGRDRYGTVEIQDDGSTITVTGRGWADQQLIQVHAFTVDTSDDGGGGEPGPLPTPTPAEIRTRVRWYGCDLVTGRLIAPLHDITGAVSRRLGEATSASLTLPLPRTGPGAVPLPTIEQATEPGRTMVVAVVNDVPAWGGMVLARRGGTGATLDLGCVTIEGYLDRRYVRDHVWTNADESIIVAGLLGDAQIEGIGLVLDIPATGRTRSREYFDRDDATVLPRLQELMRVVGGPEFTVDLDWTDDTRTAIAKIFRLRPRVGVAAVPPNAVFRTTAASVFGSRGASEARYEYIEDYADERGANHVIATASGEGEDRPQSTPARAEDLLAGGWPRWERRWSPSSSITSLDVLTEHAAGELARRRAGARTWSIEARWDQYPRLNVDWQLGDDIGWRVVGHRHPGGVVGQGRAIGWDLNTAAGLVQPILLDPASDPEEVSA